MSLLSTAGCSGLSLVYTDAAEGTLTLDGVPVPDAHVEFVPDVPAGTKAPSSSGITDEKGFFRLTRNDNQQPGALVGAHRVIVVPGRAAQGRDDAGPARAAIEVPLVYLKAAQTPLKVDVTKEQKTYDLKMTRGGSGGGGGTR